LDVGVKRNKIVSA